VAILLIVTALPWVVAARTIRNAEPGQARAAPNAIVWADRVFDSRRSFAAWLRSRGGSYAGWAAAHPSLYRVLAHQPLATTTAATKTAATKTTERESKVPAHRSVEAAPSSADVAGFVYGALGLLARISAIMVALVLLTFALGPDVLVTRVSPRSGATVASVEVRIAAAAAAISLGTGVFAAHLLG
jgi:hypothetical protein